ncbi:cellulase family glycosylhydrolase [bacterium]|nr:cellulase family glycosylhydrolase [bacterium]
MYHRRHIRHTVCELGAERIFGKETLSSLQALYQKKGNLQEIEVEAGEFIDDKGRTITFRGINIAGKTPLTDADHLKRSKTASFVNTPFSLEEAKEHFSRLKYLGFNLLRWVVPWEALAPESPGSYDKAYLRYLESIIALAKIYDFYVLIDFHQDVWSRFTGGSGAPLWTLEKLGFEVENFDKTLSAISHTNKDRFPLGHLFWATNADRYVVKTMYTLFFGGNAFAPDFRIDGKNVQEYLQDHYIDAVKICVKTLKKQSHVIGYDIMNEPHLGFIGSHDLHKYHGLFRLGPSPLPLQSFALSEGKEQEVEIFEKKLFSLKATKKKIFDPKGVSAWKDGSCIWKKLGVWGYERDGKPAIFRKHYFSTHRANEDFYVPFIEKVCSAIHKISPNKIAFIEHATSHKIPKIEEKTFKIGFSGHWYDAFVISMRKVWSFIAVDMITQKVKVTLPHFVQKNLSMQIGRLLRKVHKKLGKVPFLLSEFGIPFDLHRKKAYENGNFQKQKEGLERSFKAVEDTLVSSIIWNYTAVNSNEKGDLWNNEDFSIFSPDQIKKIGDPYSGIRAKEAIVRPYPIKTPGECTSYSFSSNEAHFSCCFTHDPKMDAPLEIFLPTIHFGKGFELQTSAGRYEILYREQKLLFYPDSSKSFYHRVNIFKKRDLKPAERRHWSFFQ